MFRKWIVSYYRRVRSQPVILLLLFLLFAPHPAHASDNPCSPGYSRHHRHVTIEMKKEVYRRAGVKYVRGKYVVDHIQPVCLGGPSTFDNLQIQTVEAAKIKDALEIETCRDYCAGRITMEEARARFHVK